MGQRSFLGFTVRNDPNDPTFRRCIADNPTAPFK